MIRGIDFNKNWKFHLGEKEEAHLLLTDESDFKNVTLPHDWSVEFSFDKESGEACTGFLPGGKGWYRKKFISTKKMAHGKTFINFDGMYERTEIYINGKCAKFHPYGYSPCLLDITSYLNNEGEENIIALQVDHSRYANSRWYTGSGIYRKVTMYIVPKIYIPLWGLAIFTKECNHNNATISCNINLANETGTLQKLDISLSCYDPDGNLIKTHSCTKEICSNTVKKENVEIRINNPVLWQIHEGKQYKIAIELSQNSKVIQEKEELFGIRSFYFDTEKGFFFNDKPTLIKGVCLHHDAGAVGAAVPLDIWRRRLEKLKDCGCNAIRTAHNPVSEDFLNLCDEMGFLVQEEFFDEWDNPKDKRKNGRERLVDYNTRSYTEFFRDYAKDDLQNVVLRDINHPCIFQWSIGNEIEWTYPKYNSCSGYFTKEKKGFWYWWNLPPYSNKQIKENVNKIPMNYYDIGSTANKLSKWVKEIDTTRPVTANCILPTVSYESGFADALDIIGYSYRSVLYNYGKEYYKDKPILGTENVGKWREWKAVLEHAHISGIFLWTGIDHMGEASVQKPWPRKGSNLGLLDFAGFEKPSYFMFKSLWTNKTVIHLETQTVKKSLYKIENNKLIEKEKDSWKQNDWHWQDVNPYWNYTDGEDIAIEAYSNCSELTLYCNDKKVSTLYLKDFKDHIYKWHYPFEKGQLKVIGIRNNEKYTTILETEDYLDKLIITSDKDNILIHPDSVAHVIVQLKDSNGNDIKNSEEDIEFIVNENGHILGIDNGNPDNVQDYQNNKIKTWHGKAMLYIQAVSVGKIEIKAICKNNLSSSIQIIANEC